MKKGAKVWCFIVILTVVGLMFSGLIDTTSATTEKTTVSVTDSSPWFTKGTNSGTGPWYPYTKEDHDHIATYVGGMSWLGGSPSEPDCWARFKPYLSQPGEYDVYAYFYACKDTSTIVPFTVRYDGGTKPIKVDQYSSIPTWKEKYLGTWYFKEGQDTYVEVTDATGEPFDNINGLTIGAIKFMKKETVPAPVVTGIDPSQPTARPAKQWISIIGTGFVSDSTVTLRIGSSTYPIPADRTEFKSSTQIRVRAGLTDPGTWTAQVTNPGNRISNLFSFTVKQDIPSPVHDMTVTDVQTSPDSPNVGQSTTIHVTVKNEGRQQENYVPVKAYVDGYQVGSAQYVTLLDGKSTTKSFTWTPSSAKTYSVKGEVGVVSGETETSDNEKTISVSVQQQNQPPNTPTMLFQLKSDGVTLIPVVSETTENSVTFKGVVSDPDGDQVKLQVELRRLDEYGGQFDETQGGFKESGFLESGSEAVAYANDLIDADYHWRARAVDEHGNEGEWEDFGNNFNFEIDFRVSWGYIKKYAPILNLPLKGEIEDRQILLGFGDIWIWTYCGGSPKKHTGVDLKANVGEDVYAAYDGVVKKVYTLSSKHNWGKGVVIEHSGFTTTYMHVNPVVNVDAHVNKGQKIAIIGSIDGYEHLHFGVRNSAYSDVSKRGALPQKQGDSDYDKEGHFTGCKNDPLFPEKFIDPMKLKYGFLGEGLTDEDRIEKIFTGPSTLEFANLNPEGELSTSLYKVIKQVLDVERAKMELEGQQGDILFNHIDNLLKQLDPEQQDNDLIIKDIVKDDALSENEEFIVGFLGGLSGVGIQLLSGVPAPFLGVGAKWLGLNIGEQLILKDLHSATVKKPEIGRMEIVYDETPKNKIWINIVLTDREDPIFITIPVVSKLLRTSWGDYICSPMWCGLTCPPEAAERALCPTIEDVQVIGLYSPGELRVYDSHGRVTGLVKRIINEEIPNSAYFNNTVVIFFSTDSYRYEVVGTDTGTYSLSMTSAEELNVIDFTATDIPTTPGAIHQYTIDWAALSQGEKGVTVKIDSDGDGVFEKTVIADNKLSQEELTPTLPVHNTNTGKSFSSIQAAVDAANAGDTIIVRDGTYYENVDIDKSITLKSSSGNPEYTIVDAVDSYADVFSVTADHVNISGFTVTGAPDFYGIYLYNADYCDISDNICSHNAASGIYLSGSNSNSISNNTCFNNGMGGICLSSSTKNSIANNTCSNNGFAGIDLGCSNQNSISNNLCCNNKLGIFLDATNNNRIYLNNFINNDCNAYSCSSTNTWYSPLKESYSYNGESHTNYLGNYWSDYTGTDANKNGIGDSPYSIDDRGGDIDQDDYPLMTWSEHYFPSPTIPTPPTSTLTPTPRPTLTLAPRPTLTLAPRPTLTLTPRPTLTPTPRPTLRPTATLFENIEGLTAAIRVGGGI